MKKTVRILPVFAALILLALTAEGLFAQQVDLFQHYRSDGLVTNPAFAGSKDRLTAATVYRSDFQHREGTAGMHAFAVHMPLVADGPSMGLSMAHGFVEDSARADMFVHYAHRVSYESGLRISYGVQAGLSHYNVDIQPYGRPDQGSEGLSFGNAKGTRPNLGLGFHLDMRNFFAGLSVPRLLDIGNATADLPVPDRHRHVFASVGGAFESRSGTVLVPAVQVDYVPGHSLTADLNLSALLGDFFSIRMSYGTDGGAFGSLGVSPVRSMEISYGLDHRKPLGAEAAQVAHQLGMTFRLGTAPSDYETPRYF